MEKIYMEESQQQGQQQGQKQRQQQKQQGLYRFSIVLSFAVAFFAVFSLASFGIAISQNTGISYAAPLSSNTFSFYTKESGGSQEFVTGHSGELAQGFRVPLYYADSTYNIPIFCIEYGADVEGTNANQNIVYNKKVRIDDYGLLYILNNSSANQKNIVNGNPGIESWATQVAIWLYLHETAPGGLNEIPADKLNAIKTANIFNIEGTDVRADGVWEKIRAFVDAAKKQSNVRILTVTKASDALSKTTDDKYYQTSLISVTGNPSGALQTYDITSISGVDGVKIIDENGTEMKALTGLAPSKKFHVLIPADQVTSTAKSLKINVVGHFDYLTGDIYMNDKVTLANGNVVGSGELQQVVTVTGTVRDESTGIDFNVVGTPDTGMSASQTIYFIGLIVLLCGVGIVYANAKPVESKQ